MKEKLITSFLSFCLLTSAQVAVGTDNPDPSAILEVSGTHYDIHQKDASFTTTLGANGEVSSVTVDLAGAGYRDGDIPVAIKGDGFGAYGTATVVNGEVTAVTIINSGSGYTQAEAVVLHSNKGFLFPRIPITDITNTSSPVNNPKDGLLAFNNDESVNRKGLYYFNSTINAWDKGLIFPETPKSYFINFDDSTTSEDEILNNTGTGGLVPLGGFIGDDFILSQTAKVNGTEIVNVNGVTRIALEPGKYLIELSFDFIALQPDNNCGNPPNCTVGTSDFQYNGLFYDAYYYRYDKASGALAGLLNTLPGSYNGRFRKEGGYLVKIGEIFKYRQYYSVDLEVDPDPNIKYVMNLFIGRMSGSSVNDAVAFQRSTSYIKFLKF